MVTHNRLVYLADAVREKFPEINQGGCCHFAVYTAEHIQHHFEVRIVAFSRDGRSNIDKARRKIRTNTIIEWKNQGCRFDHMAVEIVDNKGRIWHYDSCGLFPGDGSICRYYTQLDGSLTLSEAVELSETSNEWNSRFNKQDAKNLKRLISDHFSQSVKVGWESKIKTFINPPQSTITC